jgi:hypothetical protein
MRNTKEMTMKTTKNVNVKAVFERAINMAVAKTVRKLDRAGLVECEADLDRIIEEAKKAIEARILARY